MPAVSELLVRIDATTESLRRELQRADQQLSNFEKNTDRHLKGVDRNVSTLGQRFQNFNSMLGTLGVGMGALEAGKWVLRQADAFVQLENKIKVVTASETELRSVMNGLFGSAQRYSVELGSQVDLYSRLSGALQHTGISQQELLEMTDTFAAALKAGGATTAEASQGIQQLTQAFRGGKLQAEEMNTLLDTMPDYMNAVIAEVARVNGVSLDEARAKIKDFGEQGKINLDILVAAAENMRAGVIAKVGEMGDTTENAMTRLRNSMTMAGESFKPLIPAVTAFFEDLSSGATKTADQVKQFSDTMGRAKSILEEFLGVKLEGNNPFDALNKAAATAGNTVRQTVGGITKEMSRMADATADAIAAATAGQRAVKVPAGAAPIRAPARPRQKGIATDWTDISAGMGAYSAPTSGRTAAAPRPTAAPRKGSAASVEELSRSIGGFQSGGHVDGPGGPKDDDILALVSAGEFIVNAEQSRKHRALLEAINDNKFAGGGAVGYVAGGTVAAGPTVGTATKVAPAIDGLAGSISQTFNEVSTRWNEASKKVDAQRAEAQRRMEADDKAIAAKAEEDRKARAAAYKPVVATADADKKKTTAKAKPPRQAADAKPERDKEQEMAEREGQGISRAVMTLTEEYAAKIQHLDDLLARNTITQDEHARAVQEAGIAMQESEMRFEGGRQAAAEYLGEVERLDGLLASGAIGQDEYNIRISEAQQKYSDAQNSSSAYANEIAHLDQALSEGKISQEEYAASVDLARASMDKAAQEGAALAEEMRTPLERYNAEMQKLNELWASGSIGDETKMRKASQLMEQLREETYATNEQMRRLQDMSDDLGMVMAGAFEDAVLEGGKLRDILSGLWDDIQRIVMRQLVTIPLASAISSVIGGAVMGGMMPMGGMAEGGEVKGPGSSTSDSVPALLSSGEFVVNAQSAKRHRAMLEAINDNRIGSMGSIPKFAAGGIVGSIPHFAAGGFVGSGSSASAPIEIKLENKSSTPLKLESQSQRKAPNGGHMISVMVTDAVKAALNAGEFDKGMSSRYGASVQPIGR